jgi:hypothetical protein
VSGDALVVERVGVGGESLTVKDSRVPSLLTCGTSFGPPLRHDRWCARGGWRASSQGVGDPRLGFCTGREGRTVAYAWLNPASGARWLVVDQPGFKEVYRVVLGLPVRVTTIAWPRRADGGVTLSYAQYGADGRELDRRSVVAYVAG